MAWHVEEWDARAKVVERLGLQSDAVGIVIGESPWRRPVKVPVYPVAADKEVSTNAYAGIYQMYGRSYMIFRHVEKWWSVLVMFSVMILMLDTYSHNREQHVQF